MDPYGQQAQAQQPQVEEGKMFVGGLSWDTTKETLAGHFGQYGEVEKSEVMVDNVTKKPRGFGFITYKSPLSVQAALSATPHIIDNKTVDPKVATMKGQIPGGQSQQGYSGGGGAGGGGGGGDAATKKKIFIGGLAANTTNEEVKQYFMGVVKNYGQVGDVELKIDPATHRMRGFGFVGFDSEETVEKVVQQRFHQICGKSVEAKKAEARNSASKVPGQQHQHAYGQRQQNYGGGYGGQQQHQQGYGQYGYNYESYMAAAAAAGYNPAYQYPGYANQQASATPQQMGGGVYGQDSAVARGTGYNTSTAGYSQFPQGTSTYDRSQANTGANYQQQSYPANQAAATYSQPTGGQQNQYYQGI